MGKFQMLALPLFEQLGNLPMYGCILCILCIHSVSVMVMIAFKLRVESAFCSYKRFGVALSVFMSLTFLCQLSHWM